MEEIIKRLIARLFPEIAGRYHLPRFAIVTGIADAPAGGGLCDNFRPRYAVDLQILGKDGEPDEQLPPLFGVPVSMATGGDESGFLALPSEGTKVVIQFINGLPNWPIVTAILPNGLSLAPMPKGNAVWVGGLGAEQSVSALGDWSRTTTGNIIDTCDERQTVAYKNKEQYRNTESLVAENVKQTVGGDKQTTIAGKHSLLSANDMTMQTAANMTISAANKLELIAGNEYSETTRNLRSIKADKLYLGDQTDNSLQLLLELMTHTADLANSINQLGIAQQIEKLKLRLSKMLPKTL